MNEPSILRTYSRPGCDDLVVLIRRYAFDFEVDAIAYVPRCLPCFPVTGIVDFERFVVVRSARKLVVASSSPSIELKYHLQQVPSKPNRRIGPEAEFAKDLGLEREYLADVDRVPVSGVVVGHALFFERY